MEPFRPNSDVTDQMGAARTWIKNHRKLVAEWVPDGGPRADSTTADSASAPVAQATARH
jgi:hypothetical protein